jgi:hypothetical protein
MIATHELKVYWSDEDDCYIGQCPTLFGGGVHGKNKIAVFKELCQVVKEWEAIKRKGPLRHPVRTRKHKARAKRGR